MRLSRKIYIRTATQSLAMECLKQPTFLVGEIDEDIDLQVPPSSGEEYIKRVALEAQQYSDVMVADIDRELLQKPTLNVEPLAGRIEAPSCLIFSLEWQQCQVADFSDVRLYISRLKSKIQTFKRKRRPPKVELPDIDDQSGWIAFCSETSDETDSLHHPTLNIVFSMNQPTVEQVLEYLVEFIQIEGRIDNQLGQWIYALLAALELPLNPDACSCLRLLARTCSAIRTNSVIFVARRRPSIKEKFSKKLEVHELRALNLFISLVARYFRQLDLVDP